MYGGNLSLAVTYRSSPWYKGGQCSRHVYLHRRTIAKGGGDNLREGEDRRHRPCLGNLWNCGHL